MAEIILAEEKRMRVLVINTVRFELNGIASVILNYFKAMDSSDLQVEFVTIDDPSPEYAEFFAKNDITCHVLYKSKLISYFCGLIRLAKSGKFDIAHIHGNSANAAVEVLACWLAGIRIRIVHSHNTSTLHPVMNKVLYPFFSLLYTHGFACGRDAGRWMFHSKPFVIVKNGIDLKKYSYNTAVRSEYRKKLGAGNRTVIGHVGNFVKQKNHAFLLEVFAELLKMDHKYLLVLVGEGNLLEEMKEKARMLQIESDVVFVGKTTVVQHYLQALDLFVLPSWHEGLPVALIEAQAAGLPCMVSDRVTKEADLTDSITYIPIDNPKDWAVKIQKKVAEIDPESRQASCDRWQKKIADAGYDINQNADRMKKLYIQYYNKTE